MSIFRSLKSILAFTLILSVLTACFCLNSVNAKSLKTPSVSSKMAEKAKPEIIKINEKTKNILIEFNRVISELQGRAQLVVQTYLDALGKDGKYKLSSDFAMLIKQIETEPVVKAKR